MIRQFSYTNCHIGKTPYTVFTMAIFPYGNFPIHQNVPLLTCFYLHHTRSSISSAVEPSSSSQLSRPSSPRPSDQNQMRGCNLNGFMYFYNLLNQ